MKKTISILLFSTLLICCKPQHELNGVWCLTQSIKDQKKTFDNSFKSFFDFNNDSVKIVTIGDPSTGDYSKVNILKGSYIYTNSSLTFFNLGEKMKFKVSKDNNSIYLTNTKLGINKVELKQLDTTLKYEQITKDCFNGSYVINNKNYTDSIDFINDSILLYTGEYDINFPAKKWEIINYKGFNILNIHNSLHEIILIKSCSKNRIVLQSPFFNDLTLTLTPTSSSFNKSELIGNWVEIKINVPKPLPPSNYLKDGDQYYKLTFGLDSIKLNHFGREKSMRWSLSSDGKRIYFIDKQFKDESFSWKILKYSKNEMTIKIISSNGFEEEIIWLKKE